MLLPKFRARLRAMRQARKLRGAAPVPIVTEPEWKLKLKRMEELVERHRAKAIAERKAYARTN